jgi:hypothetical protein
VTPTLALFARGKPLELGGSADGRFPTEAVSKHTTTISIERNTTKKSIVARFCANALTENRQNRKLRMWFCVFTHPRPEADVQSYVAETRQPSPSRDRMAAL